jgi:ABC-type transport system substrate-binding protein
MYILKKLGFPVLGILALFFMVWSTLPALAKDGGVLKLAIGMNPIRLDPPNATGASDMIINAHIFERLVHVQFNEKTRSRDFIPVLAERWQVSPDKKVWTFFLRKEVKFHDGTPFNAEAVKFNVERLIGPQPQLMSRDYMMLLDRVEVVNDYTIRFYCKTAVAPFLDMIEQSYLGMVSPAAVQKYGKEIHQHPVGTGPFKFTEWAVGQKIVLSANKEYWKGSPKLDGLEILFVPDDMARVNMLQTGEVDVAYNLPIPLINKLKEGDKIKVVSYPTAELLFLTMNCQAIPTNDVRVRQAIKMAIDRRGIVKSILRENAQVGDSQVSEFTFGRYSADPVAYDPQAAKKLLTEAGWVDSDKDGIREKEGKKLTLNIRSPSGRYPMDQTVVEAIQTQLRDVGFDTKVILMEFGAFIGAIYRPVDKATGDAFMVSWSSRSDAWFALHKTSHSSMWMPVGSNATYYKNEEVDSLLDRAFIEMNPDKRWGLYRQVQIILNRDVTSLPLWFMNSIVGFRKNVHGVTTIPIPVSDQFNVKDAWFE